MTLLVLLSNNDKWLKMTQDNLYNFAVGVAKSKPVSREKILENIKNTIQKHLIDFNQAE